MLPKLERYRKGTYLDFLREGELEYAHGIGGLRPQVIDRTRRRLMLGRR